MSYALKLIKNSTVLYTFPVTSFLEPRQERVYNSFQPPGLVAVDKIWTIRGCLKGTSQLSTSTLWTTLIGVIESLASQPDGAQLIDGSNNVIEDISSASSYALFKIEELSADRSPKAERMWHSEINFTMKLTARHRLANVITIEQHDSFVYSEEGLLTRTLAGVIETAPGTSAVAEALTLGLTLPGPQYAFITNGPGGINVEKQDLADTKASWTSSYGQSGQVLPAGVGPDFSTKVESTTSSGEQLTVTTVTARGPGAAAAVASKAPAGNLFSKAISTDAYRLTATAVYVQKALAQPGRLLMLWSFSISGGAPGAGATERTGQQPAALHVTPITPVKIVETVTVEVIGTPSDSDFTMPDALNLDGVLLDGGAKVDPGHRIAIGTTRAQDRWSAGCVRNYVAATVPQSLPTLIGQQVLRPDDASAKATTPGKILAAASGGGAGGRDLSGLGLGIGGFTAPTAGPGDAKLNLGLI